MSATANPIVITGTGAAYHGTKPLRITGILVNASGDTWSVILKDAAAGNIIFQATQPLVNDRFKPISFSKPIEVAAVYATTLTNITNVLVYFDPV